MAKTDKESPIERYKREKLEQEKKMKKAKKGGGKKTSKKTTPKKTNSKKANNKKSTVKKQTKKQSKANKAVKEEVTNNPNTSTSELVNKLRNKLGNLRGGQSSGQKFNYIKLERGVNHLRIVEPTNGPLMILYKRHKGRFQGRFRTVVDLNWLISDNDVLEAMIERDKINDHDLDLIQRYGDPFNVLFQHLNSAGRADDYSKAGIGQKRSLTTVFMDGEFGVLDQSMTFGENIIDLLEANPNIISWEEGVPLRIKATGEGLKRKYSQPVPVFNEQGPLDLEFEDEEDSSPPNLYDVLASNVMHYNDKVQFLMSSYRKLVDIAALDVEDFGISDAELSTNFNHKSNKKGTEDDLDDEDLVEESDEEELDEEELDEEELDEELEDLEELEDEEE